MAPLRVLISSPSLDSNINVSGISAAVSALISTLHERVAYAHLPAGSPQHSLRVWRLLGGISNALTSVFYLLISPARIVHVNTSLEPKSIVRDTLLVLTAKLTGKRVLLHLHGGRFLHRRATGIARTLISSLARMSDRVVLLSETEKKQFAGYYLSSDNKVQVIYNSIILPRERPLVEIETEERGVACVYSGRLVLEKGLDTFIELAKQEFDFKTCFVIYGAGPMLPDVQHETSLNDRLEYGGLYNRNDWQCVLERFDFLVLPSLGEGMPMIMLEAMSLGVIPIATPFGSIPELLGDGARGIVVPPNDAGAIADVVRNLYLDGARRLSMAEACRAFIRERCNAGVNAAQFLDIYRDLSRRRIQLWTPR